MKKTWLAFVFFSMVPVVFAAFPKPDPAKGTQAVSTDTQQTVPAYDTSERPEHKPPGIKQLLLERKLAIHDMRQRREIQKAGRTKVKWLPYVGGILMGLTGIGFAVSRLTHNQDLRKGATLGFKIFLIAIGAYLVLVLFILLLFASLGLIR